MKVTDDNLISSDVSADLEVHLKSNRKRTILQILGLIVFKTVMFSFLSEWGGIKENILTALNAQLVGFTLTGFILGSFVALLPYKGLGYSKKYLRASLLTILVLETILAIGLLVAAIMTIVDLFLNN